MAELNLRINTQQAAQAAKAFERIITDIKQAARSLDSQNLAAFARTFQNLTSSGANLLAMVNNIADALGRVNYTLQSLRAADFGGKLASDFGSVRNIFRDMRTDLGVINTQLRETVNLAGRAGTASQRVRRARAPAEESAAEAATETAAVMSTALVPATTRALTVFETFRPVASAITLVTTAVTGLAREMRLLTSGAESADRSMRQLVATVQRAQTAFRVGPGGQAAMANQFFGVAPRPGTPLQLGPGGMGQAGAMAPYQRPPSPPIITPQPGAGLTPFVHQGEAVNRFGTALMNVQQPLTATSRALEHTKERKDRLDKNLKDTAQNTIPKFNSAWFATIGVMALFTARRIIDELVDLGKQLFKTGEEFERIFAMFKAGAGDNVEEAKRRMQVAADAARKFGLDLTQTAGDYGRLQAAAKGSSLEGAKMEEVFKNLVSAQAVFGQSTEKGTGLIKVFTDILGKGRLQSEELVKQLGNVVPGAFRVVAESLGKTTTELQDAVAKGSVTVEEVLTKLARELNRIYGAEALQNVNRLGGAFNNLKQSVTEVALLIVNMSTGIMMGSGSTFGQALIGSFKELSALLQNREIQTHIVELANFITNMLAKAFQGFIAIVQFATSHMWQFIAAITALTSAALLAGVVKLGYALASLFTSVQAFARSPGGMAIMLASFILSLTAGTYMAVQFQKSMEGVAESVNKMYDEMEKRRATSAQGNQNPADQTRAIQEALNRVEREQRAFVEGVRNEAQMLELAASGVSTLSARYEAYLNVLERIKAQEVKELFDILSPGDAATMKRRLTEALLAAETVKQAVGDIVGMFKSLDQEREQFVEAQMSMTENLRAVREGTFSEIGQQIQEQYDQKVIPVMRRVREELRFIADPSLRATLVGTFNAFSEAMRDNIVQLKIMQGIMGGIGEITKSLQDFRLEKITTDLMRTVKDGQVFVDTTKTGMSDAVKTMLQEGFPDLKPPNVRSLGMELSDGFNPAEVGREMGLTFTEVFVSGMEASVQKIINEMKAMVEPKTQGIGGTGGPYLPQAGKYQELFERVGKLYNVDPEFMARIARFESNFNPKAVALNAQGQPVPGGGQGMGQFIPSSWKQWGKGGDVFDVEANVDAMGRYVQALLKQHSGDTLKVAESYRGREFAKDQEYFNRVLGGYGGTGYGSGGAAAAGTAVAAAKPPPTTTASTEPQGPGSPAWEEARARRQQRGWGTTAMGWLGSGWDWLWHGGTRRPEGMRFGAGEVGTGLPGLREQPGDLSNIPKTEDVITRPAQAIPGVSTEERAKQTEEETKAIRDQVDAIRKRNEATQRATDAQDRMNAQTEKQKQDLRDLQVDIDATVAILDKQVVSTTNLGIVQTSDATRARAQAEGDRMATQARRQYVGITEQMLEQIAKIGQAKVYNQAIQQGDEFTKNIERQTKAIKEETAALSESPLTKDASALARQRQREVETTNAAFTPKMQAERDKAILEEQAAARDKSVQAYIDGSQREQRMLQMEIDSLNDNTIARAANLEMRKKNDELLRNAPGLGDEAKRQILEQNEALRRQRIAVAQANGPLRQYIDSLDDFSTEAGISNAMQERAAELFSNLEDQIISFAKTGKINFGELADSFIESIQRMVLQALIFRPIAEALNQALSGASTAPGSGIAGSGGGSGNWFSTILGIAQTGLSIYSGNYAGALQGFTSVAQKATVQGEINQGLIQDPSMFATGGVVPGGESPLNTFQGGGMQGVGTDTVPALLTPGEVVLNRAQQDEIVGAMGGGTQNNTFNMVFPNVSNEDQARKTAAQAYSEISARLERQRVRDGIRTRR